MHVCPPLAGVELEESDARHAVPASGEGQPGFVFLRVFVCLWHKYRSASLGKLCGAVQGKVAISGAVLAPLWSLKSGCLSLRAPSSCLTLAKQRGLRPASLCLRRTRCPRLGSIWTS